METLDILEELGDIIDDRPAEEIKGFVKGMIFTMYLKESFVQGIRDSIEEAVEESDNTNDRTCHKPYRRVYDSYKAKYNNKIADVTFDTYEKAFNVMSDIDDILKHSGKVTVKDFFNICGLNYYYSTVTSLSCRFYGWKDISSFTITRDDDGYFHINMPPVVCLV